MTGYSCKERLSRDRPRLPDRLDVHQRAVMACLEIAYQERDDASTSRAQRTAHPLNDIH